MDNVTVAATFTKVAERATVSYVPSPAFALQSTHTATLTYPGASGAPTTLEWKFTVGVYTRDTVQSRLGILRGSSTYTENAGGHTKTAGDYAIDLTRLGGGVGVADASFLNAATTNDVMAASPV